MLRNRHSESVSGGAPVSNGRGFAVFMGHFGNPEASDRDSHGLFSAVAHTASGEMGVNTGIDWTSTIDRPTDRRY